MGVKVEVEVRVELGVGPGRKERERKRKRKRSGESMHTRQFSDNHKGQRVGLLQERR